MVEQDRFWGRVPRRADLSQGDAFEHELDYANFSTSHQSKWPTHDAPRPFDAVANHAVYLAALDARRGKLSLGYLFEGVFSWFAEELGVLSHEEARFWLRALCDEDAVAECQECQESLLREEARARCAARLACIDVSSPMTPQEIKTRFEALFYEGHREQVHAAVHWASCLAPLAQCVRVECGVEQGLEVLFSCLNRAEYASFFYYFGSTEGHEPRACELVREYINEDVFNPSTLLGDYSTVYMLANVLERCPERSFLEKSREAFVKYRWSYKFARGRLPMSWSDPEEIISWFTDFKAPMSLEQVRDFHGRFGEPALNVLMKHISGRGYKKGRAQLLEVLWPVCSTKMAAWMLDFAQKEETREAARHWLYGEGVHATLGLMQIVKSRGKRRNQAIAELRELVARGHRDEIKGLMVHVTSPTARELITKEVLGFEPTRLEEAEVSELPEWVNKLQAMDWIEQAELDDYVAFFDLESAPSVKLEGNERVLPTSTLARLFALTDKVFPRDKRKGVEALYGECEALLGRVREGVNAQDLGLWLWHVLEVWWAKGHPFDHGRCVVLIGHCGTEREAVMLEPRIRQHNRWFPHGKHDQRHTIEAISGLGVMGTPTSLMMLSDLCRLKRGVWLKRRAQRMVDQICEERGWTTAMWEDRSVSHGGLDERGTRVFDYGARQFELRFRGAFDVEFVNEQGDHFTRLPPARKSDDVDLVRAARQDYKVVKAQLGTIIEGQTRRFEQAMLNLHEWSARDWWQWVARHPILCHFARKLVWLRRDARGEERSFVLTPEGTTIDADYEEISWEDDAADHVMLLHPAELDAEALSAWVELCADFEIVQPLAQLERDTYDRTHGFEGAIDILGSKGSSYWDMFDQYGDRYWGWNSLNYSGEGIINAMWRDYGPWRVVVIQNVYGWKKHGVEGLPGPGVYVCRGHELDPEAIVAWEDAPLMLHSETYRALKKFLNESWGA